VTGGTSGLRKPVPLTLRESLLEQVVDENQGRSK